MLFLLGVWDCLEPWEHQAVPVHQVPLVRREALQHLEPLERQGEEVRPEPWVHLEELVRQCRAAIAWVYRNADTFGGDRDRIFISGHSSGGVRPSRGLH